MADPFGSKRNSNGQLGRPRAEVRAGFEVRQPGFESWVCWLPVPEKVTLLLGTSAFTTIKQKNNSLGVRCGAVQIKRWMYTPALMPLYNRPNQSLPLFPRDRSVWKGSRERGGTGSDLRPLPTSPYSLKPNHSWGRKQAGVVTRRLGGAALRNGRVLTSAERTQPLIMSHTTSASSQPFLLI